MCINKDNGEQNPNFKGPILDKQQSVQMESEHLVNGPRNDFYGDPLNAYDKHARIFNVINPRGYVLDGLDIMYVLKAIKQGREFNRHQRDNLVDEISMNDFIERFHEREELRNYPSDPEVMKK